MTPEPTPAFVPSPAMMPARQQERPPVVFTDQKQDQAAPAEVAVEPAEQSTPMNDAELRALIRRSLGAGTRRKSTRFKNTENPPRR